MEPILSTQSMWYKDQKIFLDGTESNFREAISKINPSADLSVHSSYDSDDDFSKDQDHEIGSYIWRSKGPIPHASRTTIKCLDGNFKGNELLTICRGFVTDFLTACPSITADEELEDYANTYPAMYFALNAGKFAKIKTSLDNQERFSPGVYRFGLSRVEVHLTDNDRLFIIDEELKLWITRDLGLHVERWDLPYRGYNNVIGIQEIIKAIKGKLLSYAAPQPRLVPDNELGTAQLYCAFPDAYPIGDGPYVKLLQQGALHKFLDFFNALIFGVEASRNNLVFLTGLLALLRMRYGSYPSGDKQEGSFLYDDLLDIFPMAVTGTGSGNFVAEKAMYIATQQLELNKSKLAGHRALGFSVFRQNSAWLKVALKSAIILYNWLADCGIIEMASQIPMRARDKTVEILETDNLETASAKSQYNISVSNNLLDHLHERLYEEFLHHYRL